MTNQFQKISVLFLTVSIVFLNFYISPRIAHAGLITQVTSSLGLSTGLAGYWTFNGNDIGAGANSATSNLLDESFEGAGYENSWTETVPAGTTIDEDSAGPGSIPSGGGSQVLNITSSGNEPYTYYTFASQETLVYGSFYFYVDSFSGTSAYGLIFSLYNAAQTNAIYFGIFDNGTTLRLQDDSGELDSASITQDAWYKVDYKFDLSGNSWEWKLDDVSQGSGSFVTNPTNIFYPLLGITNTNTTGASIYLDLVSIDDSNWIGSVSLNTAYDKSGNGNNGTITGAVSAPGKLGQALSFNDANKDYVDIGNQAGLYFSGPFSISAWVKRTGALGEYGGYIISDYNATGDNNSFALRVEGTHNGRQNSFGFFWENPGGNYPTAYSDTVTEVGKWYHVVATWDGTTRKVYVDGSLDGQDATAQNRGDIGSNTTIGRPGSLDLLYFPGSIDDVRMYNRALSQSEITRLYNMGAGTKVNKSPTTSMTNGLISYLTFDYNDIYGTNAYDKSPVGTNKGTITGTTKNSGKIGQGLTFDGNDDYIVLDNEPNFDFERTDPFSMAMWLKSNPADTSIQQIIGKASDYTPYTGIHFFKNYDDPNFTRPGSLSFVIAGTTWDDTQRLYVWATEPTKINDGNWHYYAITYDGSSSTSGMKIYEDGSPVVVSSKGALSTSILNNIAVGIAARGDGSPQYHENFNGSMDEVRIYNRTLSQSEITRLYNMGTGSKVNKTNTDTLKNGLVGYWTFDYKDIYGTNAYDKSGQSPANNGTISGATSAIGKIGQGMDFDGTGDYISIGDVLDFNYNGQFSVSAWIKLTALPTHENFFAIVSKMDSGSPWSGWYFGLYDDSGQLYLGYSDGSGNDSYGMSSGIIETGVWQHVTGVYNSETVTLYLNGVVQSNASSDNAANASVNSAYSLCIGCENEAADFFLGAIDDVRIYNRALSENEIKRLYNTGH